MAGKTRTKSDFVSSAGTAFKVIQTLSNAVDDLGGSDDDVRKILSDKALTRQIAGLLVSVTARASGAFPLTINRKRSRSEMVAVGNYDYVNSSITEDNFPVGEGETEVEAALIHLDRDVSDKEVLAEMERLGMRPATMDELCAFGEQYPNRQREFPIVALGSVWTYPDGDRHCGYVWESSGGRELDLRWIDGDWHAHCRFLAVCK